MRRRNNKTIKYVFIFVLIVALVLTMIFTPVLKSISSLFGNIISPVQWGVNKITTSITGVFSYWGRVGTVDEENQKLKNENRKLKEENINLKRYKNEIDKLNDLLELKGDYTNYDTTAATVIGKDAGNWFSVFTVNKGKSDGIYENSIVIVPEGIVGRVCEVGSNWSKVVSLIDEEHSVSGMVTRTDDLVHIDGDLKMMKSGLCKMSVITENADVLIGDTIVTSGVGGIYPKGITIGTVHSFKNNSEGTGSYGVITPSVDFAHLSEVLIIKAEQEDELQ